jgi:predicted membrane-bound mannosyltransferase
MVTISLFSIVAIIFIVHTILTHLINWLFRETADDSEMFCFAVLVTITELSLTLVLLHYYIS